MHERPLGNRFGGGKEDQEHQSIPKYQAEDQTQESVKGSFGKDGIIMTLLHIRNEPMSKVWFSSLANKGTNKILQPIPKRIQGTTHREADKESCHRIINIRKMSQKPIAFHQTQLRCVSAKIVCIIISCQQRTERFKKKLQDHEWWR